MLGTRGNNRANGKRSTDDPVNLSRQTYPGSPSGKGPSLGCPGDGERPCPPRAPSTELRQQESSWASQQAPAARPPAVPPLRLPQPCADPHPWGALPLCCFQAPSDPAFGEDFEPGHGASPWDPWGVRSACIGQGWGQPCGGR